MLKTLIPLEEVRPGMISSSDIYVPDETLAIIFKNTVLTDRIIDVIRRHNIYLVPVYTEDESSAEPFPPLPGVEPIIDDRLRVEAVDGIRRMFNAVSENDSDENMTTAYHAVKELDDVVDRLVDTLTTESGALVHITDLKSYDEYTYHHSISVAVLSIAIGQNLSLKDEELRRLGRCAIMHDIGKILVPNEIINKPSRLTDEEFDIMKKHSEFGFNYLRKGHIGDEIFQTGVLCHHEKVDGKGYPGGLAGERIPYFSRIISVADVYDAVTSYRSYRKPMSPANALELIMSDIGRAFDYDIVKAFIEKLELYPINSCIELSDKRRGIVMDNTNSMRPIIKIIGTGEMVDLLDFKNLTLLITGVIDD